MKYKLPVAKPFIDAKTLSLDQNRIENAVTKKTMAMLIVHIFSQTVDIDAIMKIVRRIACWRGKVGFSRVRQLPYNLAG